jgi:fatty acid desaturase
MSNHYPSPRARARARQQERSATERQMRRRFLIGLTAPALICAVTAIIVRPDSWLSWALIVAELPAAAAGIAIVFMLQDRKPRA